MTKSELVKKLESAADHLRDAVSDLTDCEQEIRTLSEIDHNRVDTNLAVAVEYVGMASGRTIALLEILRR